MSNVRKFLNITSSPFPPKLGGRLAEPPILGKKEDNEMFKNFRTKDLAVDFYKECKTRKLPHYAKDQLLRASFSVCLNLSEGSGRKYLKEAMRFYSYALGSIREVQVILEAEDISHLKQKADQIAACVYKLTHQKVPVSGP